MEQDRWEKARNTLWGTPGFQSRQSTVIAPALSFLPQASYIVETVKNDDGWAIFVQMVDQEGGQRLMLPDKVVRAIYRQRDSIIERAKKTRAQRAAATRQQKQRNAVSVAESIVGES